MVNMRSNSSEKEEVEKQKVDTGLNIPFSFVTFDSSFRNKKILLLVKMLCVWVCVCIVINSQCMMQNFFI